MKKSVTLIVTVIMMAVATLMLQGCNNDGAQNPSPASTAPTTASAPTVAVPVTTIGWGALTPAQQQEIIAIGESHPFGGTVVLNAPMDEVVAVTYIDDVPSAAQKQTLIEYRYVGTTGAGINKILVQGHLDGLKQIESIPDVLNNGNCCYKYGGCIKAYECSEPLPEPKNCAPCENAKQPKEDCKPCKQGDNVAPGPGKKQGDGATSTVESNGNNRRIVTNW